MKMVVLFGGGDGGGLIITENGVRPIPPFDPSIRLTLKSTGALIKAIDSAKDERSKNKMAKFAVSLCNLSVEQVEEVVGPLDAERSLIYQDGDGGFTCGSNGKPPIPFPWPPKSIPSVQELISAGVIDRDIIELVTEVKNKKIPLVDVFEKPAETARKLGVDLSEKSIKDLNALAPSRIEAIKNDTDREIVGFFHKVLEDGRFIETWYTRPYEIAQTLKFKISEAALERLVTGGGLYGQRMPLAPIAILVCIGIVAVIAYKWAFTSELSQIVKDRSGIEKI